MIEPAYAELFSETVTISPSSSMDVYGKYTYGTGVSSSAHLVLGTKLTVTPDGREVVEIGKAYLYGQVAVTVSSKIVLADGTVPVIIFVDKVYDQDGWHHTVVGLSA